MTRTLLISMALWAGACSQDAQRPQPTSDPSPSALSAQSGNATSNPTATTGIAGDAITLVGCLQENGQFLLANATAESLASGSAQPIEAGSTIALDRVPAAARTSVNKQVRVTGRLDSTRPNAAATTASPSGGSTSTRDDVRANSTTVASDTPDRASRTKVIVDRVEPIADTCAAR